MGFVVSLDSFAVGNVINMQCVLHIVQSFSLLGIFVMLVVFEV
jgi:hypothetical protein